MYGQLAGCLPNRNPRPAHFSARQLRPLLEREAELLGARASLNYRASTELLLQYLESRILHGFVALDQGRVCGYTFCVYEGHKAVIGDAFATGHRTMSDADTTRQLLTHVLEMLRHSPAVDRVESQLLLFDAGEFADLFAGPSSPSTHACSWSANLAGRCSACGGCARTGYSGGPRVAALDSAGLPGRGRTDQCLLRRPHRRSDQRPVPLAARLPAILHNIVRFPGCGIFEANFSWMLRDRRSRALVGMILSSRVAPEVAHITQTLRRASPLRAGRRLLLDRCAGGLLGGI